MEEEEEAWSAMIVLLGVCLMRRGLSTAVVCGVLVDVIYVCIICLSNVQTYAKSKVCVVVDALLIR